MRILIEKPPIFENCCAVFQVTPKTVFTYGDAIYNPFNLDLSEDLIEHEKVHMEQQNHNDDDAALWWGKYLRDEKFRMMQEAEAFGKQYRFICSKTNDRERKHKVLNILANTLSGPLYGRCVDHMEASLLIKQEAGL